MPFLPQHDPNVACGTRFSPPISKFIPVKRGRSIAADTNCVVIEISQVYLAAAVTGLGRGEIESKSRTKIPPFFFL